MSFYNVDKNCPFRWFNSLPRWMLVGIGMFFSKFHYPNSEVPILSKIRIATRISRSLSFSGGASLDYFLACNHQVT